MLKQSFAIKPTVAISASGAATGSFVSLQTNGRTSRYLDTTAGYAQPRELIVLSDAVPSVASVSRRNSKKDRINAKWTLQEIVPFSYSTPQGGTAIQNTMQQLSIQVMGDRPTLPGSTIDAVFYHGMLLKLLQAILEIDGSNNLLLPGSTMERALRGETL